MAITHTAPERYTLAEFEKSVLSQSPSVAVFDCDGTLWSGDAGYGFMVWSIDTGLVSRSATDWIDARYRLYLAGDVSEADMCGEMVQLYAGLREEELRHTAAEYFRLHIEPHIFPELRVLVEKLSHILARSIEDHIDVLIASYPRILQQRPRLFFKEGN